MELQEFRDYLPERTFSILNKASDFSSGKIEQIRSIVDLYIETNHLDKNKICFVVVGSMGRMEALEASDIDLIPIVKKGYLNTFASHDQAVRRQLSSKLGTKVSQGSELTEATEITDLVDPRCIGGGTDNSRQLTKRALILTEGTQAGGGYALSDVQESILDAYSKFESTRGKHVLTLANDLARYYRTLCIEYKAKVDVDGKDWATRNAKLRHSRKVWYFSCMLAITFKSTKSLHNTTQFKNGLLEMFALPPIIRIFRSLSKDQYHSVSKLLEYYAWFLDFMSRKQNRDRLSKIKHETRYDRPESAYYSVKLNSDMVHMHMLLTIDALPKNLRNKVLDWFLM